MKTVYACHEGGIGMLFIATTEELAIEWTNREKDRRSYHKIILAEKLSDIITNEEENYCAK